MGLGLLLPLVLLTTFAKPCLGASFSKKVVVVAIDTGDLPQAWPEAEKALLEESTLLGFEVEAASAAAPSETSSETILREAAAVHSADASIRIFRPVDTTSQVQVVIYESTEQTITIKQWTVANPLDPDAAVIAGIRAAEALRACFRDPPLPTKPRPVAVPAAAPEPPSAPSAADRLSRVSVGGGALLATSFRNTGVDSGFKLTLGWRPVRFFGFVLDAAYLPFGKKIEAGEAASQLDAALFRARAAWHITDKGKLRSALLFGGGSLMVIAEAVQSDGRRMTKDLTKVGYVGGAVSLSLLAATWLRLTAEVGVGAALPAVTLSHGETFAATIGRPLLDAAIQVEFGRF